MRYRILAQGHLNNPFKIVSTHFIDDRTGEERDLPWKGQEEVFSLMVEPGTIVELDDVTLPAPWMEPLDAEAKAMCEKYPDAYAPSIIANIDNVAMHGQALADAASYGNEIVRPGNNAPLYPPATQARLGGRPAPRLPTLGSKPAPGVAR